MAIFSDLELEGIMNEAKDNGWHKVGKSHLYRDDDGRVIFTNDDTAKKMPHVDGIYVGPTALAHAKANEKEHNDYQAHVKKRKEEFDNLIDSAKSNMKKNSWIGKKKSSSGKKKITFKEDAQGNIIDCTLEDEEDYFEEGKNVPSAKQVNKKIDDMRRDLTVKGSVEVEKEKQAWKDHPAEKGLTAAADVVTGGGLVRKSASLLGKHTDKIIKKQEAKRKKLKEDANWDWRNVDRSDEFTRAMNEYFDITDRETRKILLAVNEADQNKVLVSLTSKLYDNVVDRIDDIDFGEIERSKGDIEKLPNFETLHECLNNMARLLIEFKQDTKPVDTIAESVSDIIESKPIWTKAYAVNAELPMITYNTITLAIIEATSYMVSMCVEFVKSPSQDTMQIMIDKSALTKSKGHMLFKNLESFNDAYRKGQVVKAMESVIDEVVSKKNIDASKKNFLGFGFYTGASAVAAVVGVAGLLFCIIPIIRELIFLFFYYRVRISEFFDVQADLLQVNAYNVENNRLDLTATERKNISKKQMKVAEDFRKISRKIAVDGATAEKSASKDIKVEDSKKYKASDVMDELPDSASSALF